MRPRGSQRPLVRRTGRRADYALLRAKIDAAHAAADLPAERDACLLLARRLAAKGRDLGEATELAARALSIQWDAETQREVSSWLESLGDHALAASSLRRVAETVTDPRKAVSLRIKVGVLRARAGDASGAAEAFREASQLEQSDSLALELLGTLAAWAPSEVSPRTASEAYAIAAERRALAGQKDAELEDLLRGFEADSSCPIVSFALADALGAAGRHGAADEVLRVHQSVCQRPGGVRDDRVRRALAAGEPQLALAAAVDAGDDSNVSGEETDGFDDLLQRLSLFEPIAARLEARACMVSGASRARVLLSLSRVTGGPLASPLRSARAWASALASDPSVELIVRGQELAPDAGPVVMDALTDVVLGDAAKEVRLAASRVLAELAEERAETALAHFAYERGAALDPGSSLYPAGVLRLQPALQRLREEAEILRRSLEVTEGTARAPLLAAFIGQIRSMPDEMPALAQSLTELTALAPADRTARGELFRLCLRKHDWTVAKTLLAAEDRGREKAEYASALAFELGRAGDIMAASEILTLVTTNSERVAAATWMLGSVSGDESTRARGLLSFADHSPAQVRATLLALGGGLALAARDREAALGAAEAACQADPRCVRAVVLLSECVAPDHKRTYAQVMERALTLSVPRSQLCMKLARALADLGEADGAIAWTRRLLALRPGDLQAIDELSNLILEGRDAGKIADTLAWVLSQPEPSRSLSELGARVLGRLADLDTERAVVFARRALEVLGVRHELLRDALLLTAERAGNAALMATVLERWLGSGAAPAERADIYSRLAKAYRAIGDRDAEAHAIVRALDEGARKEDVQAWVRDLSIATLSAEGELSWLCARVLVADDESRAEASREYAAALFDLAQDHRGAARALVDAGDDAESTVRDAVELFGLERALSLLSEFAGETSKVETRASILRESARAALVAGRNGLAFQLAVAALEADPERAVPLEIAEASALKAAMWTELTELYDRVAGRALGRFGRRAAHFRGARFFETIPDDRVKSLAFKHASLAFGAVPSEKTLEVLARTATLANEREAGARVVAEVAESVRRAPTRAAWLIRAAEVAPEDEDGLRQRVDLLLRAVVSSTERATFAPLVETARRLLELSPGDRDVIALRTERAASALGKKTEGPEGARLALAFAELAVSVLSDANLAWRSILRAIKQDGDIDEYERLLPYAEILARDSEVAASMKTAMGEAEKPYSNVGLAALKLLGQIGKLCEAHDVRARALVMAVERESDDDSLVLEAHEAAVLSMNPSTLARLEKKVGTKRLDEVVPNRRPSGEMQAVKPPSKPPSKPAAHDEGAQSEAPSQAAISSVGPESPSPTLAEPMFDPMPMPQSGAGRAPPSLAMEPVASMPADTIPGVGQAVGQEYAESAVIEEPHGGDLPPPAVDDAVPVALSTRAPPMSVVDDGLEEQLALDERYEELATVLARREARLVSRGDDDRVRALRFRLAAVLEQRVGNIHEAKKALERILEDDPENDGALRYLADLCERHPTLGLMESAARALLALLSSATDEEKSGMTLRLARAYIALGRVESAVALARTLTDPESFDALDLAVELARATDAHSDLGRALEARAYAEQDDVRRARFLEEAAGAALAAGELDVGLARVRKAISIAPLRPETALLSAELAYRARGVGAPDEARAMAESLAALGEMDTAHRELATFLRAEALDAVMGRGAGLDILRAYPNPAAPLIALGIAERYSRTARYADALPRFAQALNGDLRGLRARERVALAAAEAALKDGDVGAAQLYLEQAARDPALAETIAQRRIELERLSQRPTFPNYRDVEDDEAVPLSLISSRAPGTASDAASDTTAPGAEEAPIPLRSTAVARVEPEAPIMLEQAARVEPEAPIALEPKARVEAEAPIILKSVLLDGARVVPTAEEPPPIPDEVLAAAIRQSFYPEAVDSAPPTQVDIAPMGGMQPTPVPTTVRDAEREAAPPAAAIAEPAQEGPTQSRSTESAEADLTARVQKGSFEAAEELAKRWSKNPDRARDVLRMRCKAVELGPFDLGRLQSLYGAALADHNQNHARAVEHVLRTFDPGGGPLTPPPLGAQTEHPGFLAVLTGPSRDPAVVALHVLWDGASGLFAKKAASYKLTGLERLVAGPATALGRIYEFAIRLLEVGNVPVYVKRPTEPKGGQSTRPSGAQSVALMQPPAAVLEVEPRLSLPELAYMLGEALASALPENAIALGLGEDDLNTTWKALAAAFGPPEDSKRIDRASMPLAESFWQTLPPRSQRRLSELVLPVHDQPVAETIAHARQSARRVGLFLCGDFSIAARRLLESHKMDAAAILSDAHAFARATRDLPDLLDLVRLAVQPEYADARWTLPPPGSQRYSTGALSLRGAAV